MTAGQLQKALDRAGMSQRGAAKEMGISERQMRRYCSGEAKVPRLVELAMLYLGSTAQRGTQS
jgi:transcriptional regulator with XRE-family HTH domain